jgi:hypothetical protein
MSTEADSSYAPELAAAPAPAREDYFRIQDNGGCSVLVVRNQQAQTASVYSLEDAKCEEDFWGAIQHFQLPPSEPTVFRYSRFYVGRGSDPRFDGVGVAFELAAEAGAEVEAPREAQDGGQDEKTAVAGLGTDAKDEKNKHEAHGLRIALALGASLDFIDLEAGDRATELWALTGPSYVTYGFLLSEKGRTYLPDGTVYDTLLWRVPENATPVSGQIDPYIMHYAKREQKRKDEIAQMTARWTVLRSSTYFPIVQCGVCAALVTLDEKSGVAYVYKRPDDPEESLQDDWRSEPDRLFDEAVLAKEPARIRDPEKHQLLDYDAAIPNQSHDGQLDGTALALDRKECVTVFVEYTQWSAALHEGERVLELWTFHELHRGKRSFVITSNGRTLLDMGRDLSTATWRPDQTVRPAIDGPHPFGKGKFPYYDDDDDVYEIAAL